MTPIQEREQADLRAFALAALRGELSDGQRGEFSRRFPSAVPGLARLEAAERAGCGGSHVAFSLTDSGDWLIEEASFR